MAKRSHLASREGQSKHSDASTSSDQKRRFRRPNWLQLIAIAPSNPPTEAPSLFIARNPISDEIVLAPTLAKIAEFTPGWCADNRAATDHSNQNERVDWFSWLGTHESLLGSARSVGATAAPKGLSFNELLPVYVEGGDRIHPLADVD
jgi:hypothetical protein